MSRFAFAPHVEGNSVIVCAVNADSDNWSDVVAQFTVNQCNDIVQTSGDMVTLTSEEQAGILLVAREVLPASNEVVQAFANLKLVEHHYARVDSDGVLLCVAVHDVNDIDVNKPLFCKMLNLESGISGLSKLVRPVSPLVTDTLAAHYNDRSMRRAVLDSLSGYLRDADASLPFEVMHGQLVYVADLEYVQVQSNQWLDLTSGNYYIA